MILPTLNAESVAKMAAMRPREWWSYWPLFIPACLALLLFIAHLTLMHYLQPGTAFYLHVEHQGHDYLDELYRRSILTASIAIVVSFALTALIAYVCWQQAKTIRLLAAAYQEHVLPTTEAKPEPSRF